AWRRRGASRFGAPAAGPGLNAKRRMPGRFARRHRSSHRACRGRPMGAAQAGTPATYPRERFSALCWRHGQGESRMNGVLAIYRKELQTYFRSPIAYFVVAVFLLGTGYFFLYNIFLTGIGTMDETFQNMGILLLTLIPVITMRLFSGEYSGRTMELLMTLPLKPWQIVFGKYLGATTM